MELSFVFVVVTVVALAVEGVVDAISIVEYSMMKPGRLTLPSDLNLKSTTKTIYIPEITPTSFLHLS